MSAAENTSPPPLSAPTTEGKAEAPAKPVRSLRALAVGLVAFVAVLAAAWYVVQRVTGPKDDLGRFQGTWKLAPDGRENRLPIRVKVTGDRWAYLVADKEQKRYLLTLRPEASPKEIDLAQLDANDRPSAFVLRGIYEIDGDGARIVAAPDPLPRPTAFDAPDGPPVWVLERP